MQHGATVHSSSQQDAVRNVCLILAIKFTENMNFIKNVISQIWGRNLLWAQIWAVTICRSLAVSPLVNMKLSRSGVEVAYIKLYPTLLPTADNSPAASWSFPFTFNCWEVSRLWRRRKLVAVMEIKWKLTHASMAFLRCQLPIWWFFIGIINHVET